MEHKAWITMDKSGWGPGPWQDEPDKEQYADPETGLPCLIKRNRFGALCGYVGVREGHPWHGEPYNDISPPPRTCMAASRTPACARKAPKARQSAMFPHRASLSRYGGSALTAATPGM